MKRMRLKWPLLWLAIIGTLFLVVIGSAGCAGTSTDLLMYDTIEAAAVEAQKGVDAYDAAVKADAQRLRTQILGALAGEIAKAAIGGGASPEEAQSLAQQVVVELATHLDNLETQESRRANLYAVTADNLAYIREVCERGRQLVLYRSSISEQWKAYLNATSRAKIAQKTGE